MNVRVVLTLIIVGAGIAIMYWLQPTIGGLAAALIGSLVFLFALALWTLPAGTFQRGQRMDPTQRRLVGAFLGIGLGMVGGLLVASFVPRPFNWIVLAVAGIVVLVWYYRQA